MRQGPCRRMCCRTRLSILLSTKATQLVRQAHPPAHPAYVPGVEAQKRKEKNPQKDPRLGRSPALHLASKPRIGAESRHWCSSSRSRLLPGLCRSPSISMSSVFRPLLSPWAPTTIVAFLVMTLGVLPEEVLQVVLPAAQHLWQH